MRLKHSWLPRAMRLGRTRAAAILPISLCHVFAMFVSLWPKLSIGIVARSFDTAYCTFMGAQLLFGLGVRHGRALSCSTRFALRTGSSRCDWLETRHRPLYHSSDRHSAVSRVLSTRWVKAVLITVNLFLHVWRTLRVVGDGTAIAFEVHVGASLAWHRILSTAAIGVRQFRMHWVGGRSSLGLGSYAPAVSKGVMSMPAKGWGSHGLTSVPCQLLDHGSRKRR